MEAPTPEPVCTSCCSSRNKFLCVLGAVLLAGLVGISAYLYGQKSVICRCDFPTPFAPETTPAPIVTAVRDETTNWKTYKNDKVGFELKYPNTWVEKPYIPNNNYPEYGAITLTSPEQKSSLGPSSITISYWENPENLTFEQFEEKYRNKESGLGPGIYEPGGDIISQDTVSYRVKNASCAPFSCDKALFAPIGKKKIIVISSFLKDSEIFDQILSTFKLLN